MEGGLGTDLTVLVVSLAIIPAVLACLLLCLKIRASRSNPDIYGVEGTVKRKNDEVLNVSGSDKHHLSVEDANIRTPSYDRKLPEIPDDVYKSSIKDDNSSDLYATVDENLENLLPQGASAVSDDPSHHPYAKVKKQRKQEHPYAKVRDGQTGKPVIEDEDDETEYETTEKLETNTDGPGFASPSQGFPQSANFTPWIPPPARNPSRQATPLPPEPPVQQPVQQHFSGDSQDSTYSTKGYTILSVREPLQNLISAAPPQQPVIQEGNYVTLSETSDEMYAAIEDNVYMDPEGPSNAGARPKTVVMDDPSIMYSKVDKKKKRNERQTASYDGGYATVNKLRHSSGENFGARPKQRFSAMPYVHSENSEVDYSGYEVARVDNWNQRSGEKSKNDPGYETVPYDQKDAKKDYSERTSSQFLGQTYPREPGNSGHSFSRTSGSNFSRDPGYEVLPGEAKGPEMLRDPDYETVPSGTQSREPGYETLPHRFRSDSFDPGYETLSKRTENGGPRSYPDYHSTRYREYRDSTRYREYREPGYETVSDLRTKDPDYESVVNAQGNPGSEPGYETVPDRSQAISLINGEGLTARSYTPSPTGGRGKPRAALPYQSPKSSPKTTRLNHIYRSSEPELSRNGPESTIGYESFRNQSTNHKFSTDSEEGYETIPEVSKSGYEAVRPTSDSQDTPTRPRKISKVESGSLKSRETGHRNNEVRVHGVDPEYEIVQNYNDNSILNRDLNSSELKESSANPPDETTSITTKLVNNEDINFIDEDVDSGPGTPGSPTIHMSVVDNGPGVRRASVVVIERFNEEKEEPNPETHIFV